MSVKLFLSLLGVLTIFVIMAAVLLPIFAKARECAHCLNCSSNPKQIGLGLIQYMQDNDNNMPDIYMHNRRNSWRVLVYPYIKTRQVFQCPDRDQNDALANPVGVDGFPTSYAANYTGNYGRTKPDQGEGAFAGPNSKPINIGDVSEPSTLITLAETAYNPESEYNIDDPLRFGPASRRFWAGHHGGSEYLLLDGHVKYFKPLGTDQAVNGQVVQNLWYRNGTQPLSANGVAVLQDAQRRFKP